LISYLAIISFILYSAAALIIYLYGQADHAAPADVIIILGGGVNVNGTPSAAQARRTAAGAALYKEGLAPYVLCTGGYDSPRHVKSEAAVCSTLLQQMGVPTSAILTEEISLSTEENALEAHQVMAEHHLTRALLVSDNFHLLRAKLLFRGEGIPVVESPAQAISGPIGLRTAVGGSYREVAALLWYTFKGTLHLPMTRGPFK
jgi:uncharacterized SAM-binding protein YcdF (DUF218 family)